MSNKKYCLHYSAHSTHYTVYHKDQSIVYECDKREKKKEKIDLKFQLFMEIITLKSFRAQPQIFKNFNRDFIFILYLFNVSNLSIN